MLSKHPALRWVLLESVQWPRQVLPCPLGVYHYVTVSEISQVSPLLLSVKMQFPGFQSYLPKGGKYSPTKCLEG